MDETELIMLIWKIHGYLESQCKHTKSCDAGDSADCVLCEVLDEAKECLDAAEKKGIFAS